MSLFRGVLLTLFWGIKVACLAQTPKIDSLKKIVYRSESDKETLSAALQLLKQSRSMKPEDFIKTLKEAEVIIIKSGNPSAYCEFVFSKAKHLAQIGEIDSANRLLINTIGKYESDKSVQEYVLVLEFCKANLNITGGNYRESIEKLLTVIKKAEEQNNNTVWRHATNSIGFCYMDMGRYEEAIEWFKKVINLKLVKNEVFDFTLATNNLASCLNDIKKHDTALLYIEKGIEEAKMSQNLTSLANAYNIKADILMHLNRKDKAEELLLQAIEIRKQIGNVDYIGSDMAQLSLYYASVGEYEKGIVKANEALKIFRDNNLLTKTMFAFEALKTNYKNRKDYKNYSFVLENMLSLKDSLYTKNSAESLIELQQKFEVEKKEKTIVQQQLDLVRRKILLYGIVIGILILLVLMGYWFKRYQQKQKLLDEQKKIQVELTLKEEKEKERKRIAAELHDNLGVQANAILHSSSLLNENTDSNKIVVADLQETAKEMLLNLRETLWAMKSADVAATELWLRIINFMKQMGRHYTAVRFNTAGIAPDLIIPSSQALHIVLVLQESVNNSVKHAAANSITVTSDVVSSGWHITVADDGKGFDQGSGKSKEDSYGLSNMAQRAKEGKFKYEIQSVVNKGTITTLRINS